jgi:hypothetical protein
VTPTLLALLLQAAPPAAAPAAAAPRYPFTPGETLTYAAKIGMLRLGNADLQVAAVLDSVRGTQTFRFRFRISLTSVLLRGTEVLESWVGTSDFASRRFRQSSSQDGKSRLRVFDIYPERGIYREEARNETFPTPAQPLDDTAFFYFIRLVPLEVGRSYSFDRYYRRDKNPFIIKVLKREKLELPDGRKVECLVLHLLLETQGLFSKHSDTRLWLTDDPRRLPVQIRARMPFGTVTLRLTGGSISKGSASAKGR